LSEEILQILLLYSYHTSTWNKVWGWWTWLESCRVNENRDWSGAVQTSHTQSLLLQLTASPWTA